MAAPFDKGGRRSRTVPAACEPEALSLLLMPAASQSKAIGDLCTRSRQPEAAAARRHVPNPLAALINFVIEVARPLLLQR